MAVKDGEMLSHEVRPYDYGLFATPFRNGFNAIGGGSFDPVTVSTEQELIDAVAAASPGRTILLADGDYHLTSTLRIRTDSVALRGASDDPEKAVLHGRGFGHGDRGEEMIKIEAEAVTLACLTIRGVRRSAKHRRPR